MKAALLLLSLIIFSCKEKAGIDFEKETRTILELDKSNRQQHITENAKDFVAGFSDDLISVNKGKIERPGHQDSFKRFDAYFKSVRFIKWDNEKPPIVRFSDDASVAYVVIDKLVVLEYDDPLGKKTTDTTHFAWLSVYKKENGQWKLDCIASTNK